MTSCTAPGAHCGGVVGVGGAGVGVPWGQGSYGRRKLARSQRKISSKDFQPIELFKLSGRLAMHLKGGRVERPGEGVAHWLASSLGVFAKQVEKYSVGEFLEKFSRFLRETWLQNILLVDVDYNSVYRDKRNKTTNDLDDSIAAEKAYVDNHPGEGNKVLISALGKTKTDPKKDLHLTVEGQYQRKHGFGKPGIELKVTAIPSILLPRKKEARVVYKARQAGLARRMNNARKRAGFRKGCEKMLGVVLRDYEAHLEGLFDVDKIEKQVASWEGLP